MLHFIVPVSLHPHIVLYSTKFVAFWRLKSTARGSEMLHWKKKREVQTHWFAWKFRFRDTFLPFPAWTPWSLKTPALTHYWIPILKAKTIFEASKDHKSTGYPAWMEIRRIKRLGALSLHYQGYKPKNYWLLNLWNLSLHRSIRIWKHNWVVWQKESSWVVTPCECHGYCSLGCVSNRRGMRLVESQFWGFFFLS